MLGVRGGGGVDVVGEPGRGGVRGGGLTRGGLSKACGLGICSLVSSGHREAGTSPRSLLGPVAGKKGGRRSGPGRPSCFCRFCMSLRLKYSGWRGAWPCCRAEP